jgi:hypothetical protein
MGYPFGHPIRDPSLPCNALHRAAKWVRGTFTGILVRSRAMPATDSHPGLRISSFFSFKNLFPDSRHVTRHRTGSDVRSLGLAILGVMSQDQTRKTLPVEMECRRKDDGGIRQVPLFSLARGA